jgi:putative Mg2+ transporter-C (MgtC) family protein
MQGLIGNFPAFLSCRVGTRGGAKIQPNFRPMDDLYRIFVSKMGFPPVVGQTVVRLLLAAILGGIVGLEREIKHKPAGLRTNMFMCLGSALFTMLSFELASEYQGDHTRIAAQIIPGIGFIGAGSILHSRGSVVGLTTAATIFVVAAIGMAVGGGLYVPAVLATLIALLALYTLGRVEARFELKPLLANYEVLGENVDTIITELNRILQDEHLGMTSVQVARIDGLSRVQFSVDAGRQEQQSLLNRLRQSTLLRSVNFLGPAEGE